jgi:sporulation protein YlmC with PRC-barrel domain
MRKSIMILVLTAIFGLGFLVASSYANEMATKGWDTYNVSQLLNYRVVNNQGQYLGRVKDFVTDSEGRIAFAIITRAGFLGIRGKPVAIPFEALSFRSDKNEFVLDMSRQQFASVPNYDKKADMENPSWAASTYRHFGVEPYWTDSRSTRATDPYRWGGEAQDF